MNNNIKNWRYSPSEIFAAGPLVPVLVIENVEDALPIAKALIAGGIKVLEVTLRTAAALEAIKIIAENIPDALIGAGTVTTPEQLKAVTQAGAKFAISPGLTKDLLKAGNAGNIALIPGISSISEMMTAIDFGYDHLKFFPAEASGGAQAIKAIAGPFPDVRFCPTGGISLANIKNYLALKNVKCAGGSWLINKEIIEHKDWAQITQNAKESLALIAS